MTYTYDIVCNDCEWKQMKQPTSRQGYALGENHLRDHPDHNVKLVTYEVREVLVSEQFLR